ncbi:MAG: hypothetical protein ACK55I_18205, partial [bacterium]
SFGFFCFRFSTDERVPRELLSMGPLGSQRERPTRSGASSSKTVQTETPRSDSNQLRFRPGPGVLE